MSTTEMREKSRGGRPGAAGVGLLAQFLNVAAGLPKARRVEQLWAMCTELQRMVEKDEVGLPHWEELRDFRSGEISRILHVDQNSPALKLWDVINASLRKYRFAAALDFPARGTKEMKTFWSAMNWNKFSAREQESTVAEGDAVEKLLRLLKENKLDWLRRCLGCDRWFVAGRKDQNCCNVLCRHKKYEQTPKFKEKRKAWRKKYEQTKKLTGVK